MDKFSNDIFVENNNMRKILLQLMRLSYCVQLATKHVNAEASNTLKQ